MLPKMTWHTTDIPPFDKRLLMILENGMLVCGSYSHVMEGNPLKPGPSIRRFINWALTYDEGGERSAASPTKLWAELPTEEEIRKELANDGA